jgi:hypothetical protein|tara:strand:+ start:1761 stop:1916 length:156 start_codon:yes stop_codon:yes gene_type:complete
MQPYDARGGVGSGGGAFANSLRKAKSSFLAFAKNQSGKLTLEKRMGVPSMS